MKVISRRRKLNPDPQTIGKTGKCDECGSKVQIGKYDIGEFYSRMGTAIVTFACPVCEDGFIEFSVNPKSR